jgi:hypothetical protein
VPGTAVTGNSLTVAEGTLTVAKYTAYTDQYITVPKTAVKLAHFSITAATTEAVNLNSIRVDWDTVSGAFDASDDLSNLYVKYGPNTTTTKATVTDTANTWSINYQIPAGSTINVEVYADVASGAYSASYPYNYGVASLTVTGTTAQSATSVTPSEVSGQTIYFVSGSFTASTDAGSPLAYIVAGNQTVTAAKFKFASLYENYTIKELRIRVGSGVSAIINNAILKDGDTVLSTKPFDYNDGGANRGAYFTGLNVSVPANTTKTLTVDYELGIPSASSSTSQLDLATTLSWMKYADSQGVETSDDTPGASNTEPAGNDVYVYLSIPTVTKETVTKSTLYNGSSYSLYKFTIKADTKGDIAIKQLKFPISWTDASNDSTLELESWKILRGSQDITSSVTIKDQSGNDITGTSGATEADTAVVVTFNTEETIPAGTAYTYTLKATPQGFHSTASIVGDDSVALYLAGDTSHNGSKVYVVDNDSDGIYGLHTAATGGETAYNFIWSDVSSLTHSYTNGSSSNDWADGYLVLNLPLDGETWSGQ